ncbi:hypothetical protein AB1Y20_022386 [Prymnesium parvum]|uniref:RING-type domain-containing protein n=1 Tax=Prymnesium parvum TaxID=97485 RepID=A0AB34JJF9_PRYPA
MEDGMADQSLQPSHAPTHAHAAEPPSQLPEADTAHFLEHPPLAPSSSLPDLHAPSPPASTSALAAAFRSLSRALCHPHSVAPAHPHAIDSRSADWVSRDDVVHCPICQVELGTQHKNITKRHCRLCGGVFCYTCTYDKITLRHAPEGVCFPTASRLAEMHVCVRCYDLAPTPADGLRRCRICHQKVRLTVFDAHLSVCTDEYQGRSHLAPQQWEYIARRRRLRLELADCSEIEMSPQPACSNDSPPAAAGEGEGEGSDERPGERDLPEWMLCVVCMTNEANAAIISCGHAVACVRCCERFTTCPVCRKPIERLLRIYHS